MSIDDLRAEVHGGREAFAVVVEEKEKLKERLEQAERNSAEYQRLWLSLVPKSERGLP